MTSLRPVSLFVLAAASFQFALCLDFSWSDCGGSILKFNKVDFNPKPLVVSKTKKIQLTADVSISENIPDDASIHLVMNKTVVLSDNQFVVTIPCVDGIGSCKLNMCDMFHLWYNDVVCPFFQKQHRQCSCPVLKGDFVAEKVPVEIPLDKLHGMIAWLAKGDYHFQFIVSNQDESQIYGCLKMAAHLELDPDDH